MRTRWTSTASVCVAVGLRTTPERTRCRTATVRAGACRCRSSGSGSSAGFATGGGWFTLSGEKVNFGFTMKYGKNGANLKGSFIAVRHYADGTTVRLKSNALEVGSLAIRSTTGCGTASFSGRANYTDRLGQTTGNIPFTVYASDCNRPGIGVDSIWISATGELTMPGPASSNLITLGGGQIAVPHTAARK